MKVLLFFLAQAVSLSVDRKEETHFFPCRHARLPVMRNALFSHMKAV